MNMQQASSTSQPISDDLRRWVAEQLAAGHTIGALRNSMREAGWMQDAIDAALGAVVAAPAPAQAPVVPRNAMPGPALDGAPCTWMRATGRCRCCSPCAIRA